MEIKSQQFIIMDKLAVLQRQHQNLAVQLEEKKRESRLLQDRVSVLEAREQEYAQTLLTVNRCWEQLQDDLQAVWRAAALSEPPGPASTSGSDDDAPAVITDPFLRKLLAGANASLMKEAQDVVKSSAAESRELEETLEQVNRKGCKLVRALSCLFPTSSLFQVLLLAVPCSVRQEQRACSRTSCPSCNSCSCKQQAARARTTAWSKTCSSS